MARRTKRTRKTRSTTIKLYRPHILKRSKAGIQGILKSIPKRKRVVRRLRKYRRRS